MVKITRLLVVAFGLFVPIYILIIFLPIRNTYEITLWWLNESWTTPGGFLDIMVKWVAPFLFCGGWIYFMLMFGKRLAATIEKMMQTSSNIAAHYLVFYGVCAIAMLISFLLPLFTPVVSVLSYSSVVFRGLTSRVIWKDLDDKTKKFVKTITILIDIPVIFCTILVLPDVIIYSWSFFKTFWQNLLDPLYYLMRALAAALTIGNFVILYKSAVNEVDRNKKATIKGNGGIIFTEILITGFLFLLAMYEIPFVTLLYYVGAFFWFLSLIVNFVKGRRSKGVMGSRGGTPQNTLSLLLFAIFYVATTLFIQTGGESSPLSETLGYVIVFGAAFVFLVVFLVVFVTHPDLDDD